MTADWAYLLMIASVGSILTVVGFYFARREREAKQAACSAPGQRTTSTDGRPFSYTR